MESFQMKTLYSEIDMRVVSFCEQEL